MWLADLIGGVVVLLFGLSVVFFSSQLPYSSDFGPARFLPSGWASASPAAPSSSSGRSSRSGTEPRFLQAADQIGRSDVGHDRHRLSLLPLLGFSVGLALFTATAMRIIGKHPMLMCGLTAVGTAIGIISSSASG